MSEKEIYLEYWGYTLGTPEAEAAWKAKQEFMQSRYQAAYVMPDLPGYESPIDGKWVEGRAQRREDLKRHGCIPYDPEMKKDAKRFNEDMARKNERALDEAAHRAFYSLDAKKQRLLREGR